MICRYIKKYNDKIPYKYCELIICILLKIEGIKEKKITNFIY